MNYAIIVAGGKGRRFSGNLKKQFFVFNGKTVLELTVEKFDKHESINKIVVVLPKDEIRKYQHLKKIFPKVASIVTGGETRFNSVLNGLKYIESDFNKYDKVLIHDGVRPFVTAKLISRVLNELDFCGCVVPGIKLEDTVKKVDAENIVTATVNREKLFRIQTPQGFGKDVFAVFNDKNIIKNASLFSDDASVYEFAGNSVKIVSGEKDNIKITTPEDLKFFTIEKTGGDLRQKAGFGFDVHRFSKNRKLILGGVEIPFEKGLAGHSDADVVIHAVIDALLGALGKGDIGEIFPDSDEKFKNIDSSLLLREIFDSFVKNSFEISNIDVTIVCEEPKLKSFKNSMKQNIANCLNIHPKSVNIKATTTEGLGFTGRKEGIAAYSTVLISEK